MPATIPTNFPQFPATIPANNCEFISCSLEGLGTSGKPHSGEKASPKILKYYNNNIINNILIFSKFQIFSLLEID